MKLDKATTRPAIPDGIAIFEASGPEIDFVCVHPRNANAA